jgi:hypothetical protein
MVFLNKALLVVRRATKSASLYLYFVEASRVSSATETFVKISLTNSLLMGLILLIPAYRRVRMRKYIISSTFNREISLFRAGLFLGLHVFQLFISCSPSRRLPVVVFQIFSAENQIFPEVSVFLKFLLFFCGLRD